MRSNTGGTGGGGVLIPPSVVTNVKGVPDDSAIYLTWTDPEDIVEEGVVLNEWAGSVVVINEEHAPKDQKDGRVVYTEIEKNKHKTEPYAITELENGKLYYFGVFPFSVYGVYNNNEGQTSSATPLSLLARPKPFADCTWEEIGIVGRAGYKSGNKLVVNLNGQIYTWFTIGDEKTFQTTSKENITLSILDFQHDEKEDGTKAGISLQTLNCLAKEYPMDNRYSMDEREIFWGDCVMRKTTLPNILKTFPADLQAEIVPVKKISQYGVYENNLQETIDKLWVFGAHELDKNCTKYIDGETYPVFTDDRSRAKKIGTGSTSEYWTRRPYYSPNPAGDPVYGFGLCNYVGHIYETSGERNSNSNGLAFGLCIG